MNTIFPANIDHYLKNEEFQLDNMGMSESDVYIFKDKVLKIQKHSPETENEYRIMKWLKGKIFIPEMIAYEIVDEKSYLLMSKIEGIMSCDDKFMRNPSELVKKLALGLMKLWNVDISCCPVDYSLDNKLAMARYNVEHNLVDIEDAEPGTFGEGGFRDPAELYEWLCNNKPKEELVLSHGDFCLPNVLFLSDYEIGFIDLGKTGIADKWCDIALCYRSLKHNFAGVYNGKAYPGYNETLLFDILGIKPDWKKIRYYILLDELF